MSLRVMGDNVYPIGRSNLFTSRQPFAFLDDLLIHQVRDQNSAIEEGQKVELSDLAQMNEGTGIRDDGHESSRASSSAS